MLALSLLLTAISFLVIWLILPMFILLPAAFICGFIGARRCWQSKASRTRKILACLPMILAVIVFYLQSTLISTGYRA